MEKNHASHLMQLCILRGMRFEGAFEKFENTQRRKVIKMQSVWLRISADPSPGGNSEMWRPSRGRAAGYTQAMAVKQYLHHQLCVETLFQCLPLEEKLIMSQ